ncbi:Rib/alpha-like domain-containing protein [Streptococcus suis]
MNLFKIKRNKLNRQEAFNFEKRSRFGIRKLTIGVVSLAIGSGMVLNAAEQVYAGTDFDSGEIRHVRNGSPKEMAEGSAVPGTIAEKANYRDYKIETVPVVENGVQYVDVTLTFNERGRAYSKNRFYVFNMPKSLYEPKVITREVYQQAVEESQASVGKQTYTDYRVVSSQKISTLTTSGWREEPTNVAPGTERWGVNYRYINGNPNSPYFDSGKGTMRQVIGPGTNNAGEAISWIYTNAGSYNGDWDRLISHNFDGKAQVVDDFKNKSNSIYIDQARHSREKVVYKFRARVKDQNADMNFIFGMNEMIANGHANFVAKYGKTPDNRSYKERFPVNTPAKVTVDNARNLTRDNKLAIIAKIKEANSSLFGSDNSLKTPILVEPTEADIPTNATSGNITLRYTDGSTTTIPVANTVRERVGGSTNPAPVVNTTMTYDAATTSARKTEGSLRTRIQLPEKKGVTDLGQIANPTAKIDPSNTNNTAENLWNAQLNAIRTKNLATSGGTFAENTYINSIGSATNPTENTGLDDSPWADKFSATLVKSNNQIQGILIKGPRSKTENVQADVGLITADMLFKNAGSLEPIRQSALQEIDALGAIDGKDGWKNEINSATSEEAIQAVVDKAKRAKAELDKKKDAVKAKIDALTTLTPEQKEQFKNQVDGITADYRVEDPYTDAVKAGLAKEKEQAIALINSLEHLPATGSPSKQESIDWINDPWIVPDSATLKNEVTDALINNAKIKANKELDALNPAPSNLAELKRQINEVTKESAKAQGKTGQEIIEAIVEKAKADSLKEQAKKDIAAVPGMSSTKKDEYKAKVDAATNVRDLEQIVSEAKAHAEYEKAKQTIQGLPNLNNAQKETLIRSLDDDKTQAGIAATLDEARQQDSDMARLKELEAQAEQLKNSSAYRDGQPDKKKALDDALNASKAITPSNGQRPTVDLGQMIRNLEDGINGLGQNPVARTVDKSSLNAEIQRENSVKAQNNYSYQNASEDKKQAYQTALQEAQAVANDQQATQDQVNAATDKLRNARLALDGHAPDHVQDTLADSTDLVVPEAVQIKGTTVAEDEKQTIIDALKAANPGKLPADTNYDVAPNGAVTVRYSDNSREDVNVPLKSGIPTVTTQPHDLVVFKNTDMTTPVELAGFADNESISDVQIVSTNGVTKDEMGLTVGEKDKGNNTKAALISGKTDSAIGKHTRKLRALDNLDQASAATNDFYVRIVDATVNQPETAIEKAFDQALTPEDVRPKINFNVGSGQDNLIDFEVIIPTDAPTSGQNKEVSVIIRTKAHANAPEDFKRTFVSQDKTVTVRATWPTQAAHIEVAPPADTAPALIDSARPTTETDKNALINALKEANKTPEGTSKFPENTRFDVAENGTVTITYPDRSSETVTVPFKQKDSAQHTPVVTETPINSAATANTPLTEEERNAVKEAVTVPTFTGDRQPTVTVPADARVTNGTEGNTGKPVVVATVEYPDGSTEQVEVPVKSGIPTVTTQPHDLVVFKNTDMTTPVELGGFTDNESIKDVQIVSTNGSTKDEMGLTVGEKDKGSNTKAALISGKTDSAIGKHTRKLRALDNLDQASAATNDFYVRIVDATVNQPETAIEKAFDQALTPEDVRPKINFNVGSGQDNLIDFEVIIPTDAPTSGQNKEVSVIIRTKAHANAPEDFKRTFVSQDKTVTVRATWPTQAAHIEVAPPADTAPALIDSARPTTETDKNALINALKEANKTPEGTSKFPENTRFDVAENGTVTITYPDRSSETVNVPFKQKDSAQHTPSVTETPINSAATTGTPLTEDERNAVKAAVTVPNFPAGDKQPTITVPDNASVTNGTNGNTGKPVVVATVEYPDGTTEQVEVPVRRRDNAKYEATVTNPDAPAAIKASHATGSQITDQADKNAILAKVSVPAGSNGTPSLDQNPVVEVKDGKQVVKVTVTYGDQTKDEVFVPVDQKDNETHNPTAPETAVQVDAPATANSTLSDDDKNAIKAAVTVPANSGGQVSLAPDAKVELVNGNPVVKATVTYPDGTTDIVDVPVVQKDSTKHTPVLTEANSPVLTDTPAKANEPVQETDKAAIAAKVDKTTLPPGTETKVPDDSVVELENGKPVVPVLVSYPDGTSEIIKVPVDQKDDLTYNPEAPNKDNAVAITSPQTQGTEITDPTDKAAILDSVTVPAVDGGQVPQVTKEIASPVTEGPDGPYVTVKVSYPDGTSETVNVPVNQKDNETHNPTVPEKAVQVDAPAVQDGTLSDADKQAVKDAVTIPQGSGGVASLPEDAKVELVDNKPVVPVTVTYPDNTKDTVYVPVVQKDSVKYTPSLTDANSPVLTDTPAKAETPVQDTDKAAIAAKVDLSKLPENTTAKVPDGAKVELVDNKPVVPVLVSYPDGTSETIKVPVDQKDSETYTPTAPAAETPVAITGSDAPDAPIAETDKPAILNSVTVPAVDGGQAPEVTKEITSPVKVVDGKAFVEVTVTYPDKTKEVIPVPVNQKDNEANEPTVTAPEKPAPISVPVAENTPVESAEDKKLITDKVNVAGLPNPPQSVKVAEPAKVVRDQAGNPVVNVEVTYPDGTKDIVPVPVKQADNQTNTPSLKEPELGKPAEALVAIDPTPGAAITNQADKDAVVAKVDLSKLPTDTTAAVADDAVVANDPLTNKPVVPVTVTYPDGTSEFINVPVKQADNLALDPSLKDTNPVPILTEATVGLTVSDKANLDAIAAKVDPKTGKAEVVNNTIVAGKEDGPHAGQPVVNVLVTYPDGTQDTIEVPVKQADNVANEPSLTDQTPVPIQAAATTGTPVPADDKPAILAKVNLPAGAEATIADDATVVREDGQAVVPVKVTYPDGTTDTISVPVKRADNSKYTPSQVTDPVQVDAATAPGTAITSQDDKDAIIAAVPVPKVAAGEKAPVVSLPENPQVEEVNGQPVVKAIVTYADGTTDTVDVPIVQKVSATKEPSLKEAEAGKPAQAVITENPTAGASITDPADQNVILDKVVVPEGGKASIADDAVVEMDGDQPVLPVTVTYTDGSKDIIKVPVKQADNVAKEPSLKSQTPVGVMDAPAVGAQVEEPADLEAIKNNVDTKGGTASIEDPTIVEGPNNQPAVAVKVTYPDGTADTILVPIKTADNVTYTPVLKSTDPVLVSVATDNGTAVPEADQAKILANVDVPALTADGDKPAVDLSIENPVVLQKNGQAGVEVTVTYQDGSKDKIFVPVDTDTDKDGFSNKEEEKAGTSATDPASTPAGQDSAERLNPGLTEPVEVKNPDKLTDAEKEAVKKAVEDSNDLPAGTTVSVANDGTVTVTYPDNSTDTIKPKDAVTQFVDTDGDGISDRQETENGTDPSKVDSDNDGFSDKEEVERGTDPTKADSKPASSETDTDGDGISNEDEVARGTDPNKSDTDGDGFSDQEEITAGSNPTKADSTPANVDKDGDGFTDTEEAAAGTDANNPASTPAGQDSADRLNPGLTEPVEVKNPDKLTDAEKEAVKKAVEDSNDLPEGTEVTVSDNGTVTVTYPDKSADTIQPTETVKVAKDTDKDGFTDTEEATAGTNATDPSSTPAGQDSAGQLTPGLGEPVEVKNPDKLSDAEKEAVKDAVQESNDLPAGTEITVSDNGTVTVTYPDKSTDTIQPADTVKVAKDTDKDGFTDTEEEKAGTNATDPSSTPAGQDSAGQLTPGLGEPVEVKNPDKLSDAEKEAVKDAVQESNDLPAGTEITVSDNGTVTVTYPDKSTDTIEPADTVKATKPVSETPVAPSKPEVTSTASGDVVVTPPTDNVTNLDITFTPEGASQPVTVVVSKGENGIWTAPADSGLVVNPDGTITIPAEKVADGTAVTVVAENGSVSSPEVGSTVVPVPAVTPETPVAPSKPEVTATDSGAVVVTPPTDNVTNLDITFTPEGSSQPVTVVVSKDATGAWTAPADSGLVVNPDGTITIPAENVADGTAVTVVAENGSVSSPEVGSTVVPVPTPELPAIPAKPTSVTNADGSVTIVPPVENVTGLDITFTPEGATEPVTVTLGKDATGAWTAPADSGLVVNPDGTITIPADRLADGTEGQVGLVAKNGDLTSNDPAPQVPETPAKSSVETNENGSVTIVPPVENVTGIDITFTPEGASQPVTVVVSKDATGAWTAPADSGLVVNPDGTITIPADKVADGTAVSVVTKNGQVPSDEASATYVPAKPASTETPVVEVPATPSLALDGSGNVLITPPAENATSLDITFTPAGSETPITVTANKDATGNWILPETSIAVVNPDGTISISTSEMEGGTAVSVVAKNEGVPSSQAATLLVQPKQTAEELAPTVKKPIAVEDASKLTDAEKKELEDAVRKDNVLPEGTEVSVADDGTVTVTYPDKSTDTILPTKTVMDAQNGKGTSHSLPAYDLTADEDKDGFTNEEELKQGSNVADAKSVPAGKSSAERLTPTNDLAVKVKDLTKLSDAEKETVETAIRKDKDLPEGTQIEVANDGSVTITYPDGSIGRLPADQTVLQVAHGEGTSHSLPAYDLTADEDKDGFTNEEELKQGSNVADAKSVPAGKSSAERLTPTNDLAVKVKDLTKLTDAEKKAVETAIRKNNTLPEGTQIEVANDGSVTITYPDGSVDQIVATKVVATDSTVSPDSGVSQSSGTTKVLPGSASSTRAAKKPLPATGENGSPILVLSGLALLAGVAMFRKAKREDEN